MSEPRHFYTEKLPAQWNAALEAQRARGEEGQRVYQEMCAVDATIRVNVEGEHFFLNVAAGRMSAGGEAVRPPFLTLVQERAAFERLASEAGDSALGLLGGLSGLAGEMRLTRSRLESLSAVHGAIRFTVTGERGWSLLTHFGPGEPPAEAQASISVDEEVYGELRAGRLDPPQAFLEGRIRVDGDIQLTMQLALAAVSPD